MPGLLSIGEAAEHVGVPTSTVRYYDDIDLVPATRRVSGRRRYDRRTVRRLQVVRWCQQAGFTLEEIGELLDTGKEAGHWRTLAEHKRSELDERIADLRRARTLVDEALACGCEQLLDCPDGDVDGAHGCLADGPVDPSFPGEL